MDYHTKSDVIFFQRADTGVTLRTTRKVNPHHFVIMLSIGNRGSPLPMKNSQLAAFHREYSIHNRFTQVPQYGLVTSVKALGKSVPVKTGIQFVWRCPHTNYPGTIRPQILTR